MLQPFADAIKLVVKELVIPKRSKVGLFLLAPMLSLFLALSTWGVIPFSFKYVYADANLGILYIFALSSLNVYSVILAGWASNSRYAILGSLRSAAQFISYELSVGFILLTVVLCVGSLNVLDVVYFQKMSGYLAFGLLPSCWLFLIAVLAETNRAPFDLPEAEAELVAGFNVEYSSLAFAFFFLGEYCSMLLMSAVLVLLFFGGWLLPFGIVVFFPEIVMAIKIVFICFLLIFIRANYPRFRYDQLMYIGWKVMLPLNFGFFFFVLGLLRCTGGFASGSLFFCLGL